MAAQASFSNSPFLKVLEQTDFASLLENWAGEKIFKHGLDYFRKQLVSDLVITQDNKLLATVKGSKNYVSALYLDDYEELDGFCTCPYDGICKHLVALGLQAHEEVLSKKVLPICQESDFRLAKLKTVCPSPRPLINQARLREALSKLSKDDLLELLLKACDLNGDILLLCAAKAEPDTIGIEAMLNDAKNAIAEAACDPDFDEDYSSPPDYNTIAKKLRSITAAGKADAALDLASEVFTTCSNAIEIYDQEGEVISDVGEVAEAAAAALRLIDWKESKKLIWAINAILQDDFGCCDYFYTYLDEISDASAWSEAADYLAGLQVQNSPSWKKASLTELHKLALKNAGHSNKLLKLYEAEAKENKDYLKLIDYLLEQGNQADAEKWIKKGLKSTKSDYDAKNLRERLIKIREEEGKQDAIVALQTEIFIDFPDVKEYKACMKAANAVKQWDALKPLLILYLTDGKLPWLEESWPFQNKGAAKAASKKFPLYLELTELALAENQPLEALKWYDQQRANKRGEGISPTRLADAVKDAAPERAFAIWQKEIEKLIAETNSRSYFEAGRYLEKMLAQSAKIGDQNRFQPYLRALRDQHKRKRNFIKILDAIEQGQKID